MVSSVVSVASRDTRRAFWTVSSFVVVRFRFGIQPKRGTKRRNGQDMPISNRPTTQVAVAKGVPQIPTHAQNDNHVLEVSPTEQCRAVLAHRLTLPNPPVRVLQQIPTRGSTTLS